MPLSRIFSLETLACLVAWADAMEREYEISVAEYRERRLPLMLSIVLVMRGEFEKVAQE